MEYRKIISKAVIVSWGKGTMDITKDTVPNNMHTLHHKQQNTPYLYGVNRKVSVSKIYI